MGLYDRDWYREDKKKEDNQERFNNRNSNKNSCCSNKSVKNGFIDFFKSPDSNKFSMFKICMALIPIGLLLPVLIIPILVIGGLALFFANDWMNNTFD